MGKIGDLQSSLNTPSASVLMCDDEEDEKYPPSPPDSQQPHNQQPATVSSTSHANASCTALNVSETQGSAALSTGAKGNTQSTTTTQVAISQGSSSVHGTPSITASSSSNTG